MHSFVKVKRWEMVWKSNTLVEVQNGYMMIHFQSGKLKKKTYVGYLDDRRN